MLSSFAASDPSSLSSSTCTSSCGTPFTIDHNPTEYVEWCLLGRFLIKWFFRKFRTCYQFKIWTNSFWEALDSGPVKPLIFNDWTVLLTSNSNDGSPDDASYSLNER
jgi:hypothetical protein